MQHPLDNPILRRLAAALGLLCMVALAGCEPKVGSDAWCKKMVDTPRSDWSMNDATAFAQNCVFKEYEE